MALSYLIYRIDESFFNPLCCPTLHPSSLPPAVTPRLELVSGGSADGTEDLSEGDSLELVCVVRAHPAVAKVYWALDVSNLVTFSII